MAVDNRVCHFRGRRIRGTTGNILSANRFDKLRLPLVRVPGTVTTVRGVKALDKTLNGVVLLEPTVYTDDRGEFYESYNRKTFEEVTGFEGEFLQDNHSTSVKGVLRGIHYQLPRPQGKLVRCIDGEIWDVAVDLRRSSPTFREWKGYHLSAENRHQLWIPVGFGHGFVALSEITQVLYRTTELWDPECDRSIRWDDPDLDIAWPLESPPTLSAKDTSAPGTNDALLFD